MGVTLRLLSRRHPIPDSSACTIPESLCGQVLSDLGLSFIPKCCLLPLVSAEGDTQSRGPAFSLACETPLMHIKIKLAFKNISLCVCVIVHAHTYTHKCRGVCMEIRGKMCQSVLSSMWVSPKDQTLVVKLGTKCFNPLSLTGPKPHFMVSSK